MLESDSFPYASCYPEISYVVNKWYKYVFCGCHSQYSYGVLFRNFVYDSSIGDCLRALHTSCPDDVVKLTAENLVNVFCHSMWRTKSMELKVN